MSGPTPKPAATRQRRNKTATASRFETNEQPLDAPDLGEHPEARPWHARTLSFWRDVWASPMAPEFLQADTDGLFALAVLIDQFWTEPNAKLAAEIRLQRQCFGLTPIDRRRLQWEVVRAEQAEQRRPSKRAPSPTEPVADPRAALKAI
jgi:hypothetical protein